MRLDSNTILITGGASGIGFALARRFVKAGSRVIACGRRREQLEWAQRECPGLEVVACDVSVESERVALAERMAREFPALNVLINNAGIQQRPPSLLEPQDWAKHRAELETNLHAPIHLSLLFCAQLRQQPTAAIVNVSSGLAFTPIAFMPTYCATKAALHSFTISLRFQLASSSIQVFEVVPPAVATNLGGAGLHNFGVPVDPYADDVMEKLAGHQLEFGYHYSEAARNLSRQELDARVAAMNANFKRA